ncbi:cytochrome P450 [Xylogone sp. PMI_703]|nr:cytochrome P450 [Xylogone sp. PMI_703]
MDTPEGLGYLALLGLATLIFFKLIAQQQISTIPEGLPWHGLGKGVFARLRMRLAAFSSGPAELTEAYLKYSKKGEAFVFPDVQKEFVILPNSSVKWIIGQPDDVLGALAAQANSLEAEWTLWGNQTLINRVVHKELVVRDLTRAVSYVVPQTMEEVAAGFDEFWGTDTENWREVNVFETAMKVVARSVNRTFVGFPLCRNDEYLSYAGQYASQVPLTAALIKLVPGFLRPIIPYALILPLKYQFYRCSRFLLPLIKERKAQMEARRRGEDVGDEPRDFITWLLHDAEEHNDAVEASPHRLCQRLMIINFAAIHTTTFSATNSILDVYSADPSFGTVNGLREEVKRVLTEENGVWSKKALQKLTRTDSAIRESLRISTFMTHGIDRLVLPKDGITLENGMHLPQGSTVSTLVWPVHRDEAYYPRANTYDPFRFSRDRESAGNGSANGFPEGDKSTSTNSGTTSTKGLAATIATTSDHFLAFSHGRHACPGRFFAAAELKLMLAYIVTHYDVEPITNRPENQWIASSVIPPTKATIRIRRRKEV